MEIRLNDGQVMFESEFRQHIKQNGGGTWDITTPEILAEHGATVVLEGAQATPTNHYQYSIRDGVEQIDGQWYTKYILGPVFTDTPAHDDVPAKTAQENETAYHAMKDAEQAKSVRATRDEKLKDTDWTQVADAPVDKTAWATYRQALRDLTKANGFPWDIEWPNDPNHLV
jgi:hypothetical protein